MRAVLSILARDFRRFSRVSSAWIVGIGIIVIPALYAWFNTIGFWDPYGNTKGITVSVVNLDKGAHLPEIGTVALGEEILTQLRENKDLGWKEENYNSALDHVRSGSSHAAIVIPSNFSSALASSLENTGKRPVIRYIVNEKTNGVATKITDTGAGQVDRQVNDTFVSTVSNVVASKLNTFADDVDAATNETSTQAEKKLGTIHDELKKLTDKISQLEGTLSQIESAVDDSHAALVDISRANQLASSALGSTSSLITDTSNSLVTFAANSSQTLDNASLKAHQAANQASQGITHVGNALSSAEETINSAVSTAQTIDQQAGEVLDALKALQLPGTDKLLSDMQNAHEELSGAIERVSGLANDSQQTVHTGLATGQALATSTSTAFDSFDQARSRIGTTALPRLTSGLTQLSTASVSFASHMREREALITTASQVLDNVKNTAEAARDAASHTREGIESVNSRIQTMRTDIVSVASSTIGHDLFAEGGRLDTKKISDFMLSPTVLRTHALFPVPTYGSGMAPLLINLSLWVGAFALAVIMKLEVDDDDLDFSPTSGEKYWARYLFLAVFAALQGAVTTVGELIIGVQTVNPLAFVATGVIASLSFLSIIYALSTTFLHVGKGLCVAMIILQIPGSSGLYPVEMMPGFFRAFYPIFPFTYSINALREVIGGFYGNHWLKAIAVLLLFMAVFFLIGLKIRPRLVNLNLLFTRQLEESGMVNVEDMHVKNPRVRLRQIIQALADHEEFSESIHERATRLARWYPRLRRGALVAGIIVPAILFVTFSLTSGTKVIALAVWLAWIICIIGFLMSVEMAHDSITRQLELDALSQDSLTKMLLSRQKKHGKHHARKGAHTKARASERNGESGDEQTEKITQAATEKSQKESE